MPGSTTRKKDRSGIKTSYVLGGVFRKSALSYHPFFKFPYKGSIVTIQADNEVRLSAEEETVSYLPSLSPISSQSRVYNPCPFG